MTRFLIGFTLCVIAFAAGFALARPSAPVKAEDGYQFTMECLNGTHEPRTLTLLYGEVLVVYGPEGELMFEYVAGE